MHIYVYMHKYEDICTCVYMNLCVYRYIYGGIVYIYTSQYPGAIIKSTNIDQVNMAHDLFCQDVCTHGTHHKHTHLLTVLLALMEQHQKGTKQNRL